MLLVFLGLFDEKFRPESRLLSPELVAGYE
jgi:hypothetical protein